MNEPFDFRDEAFPDNEKEIDKQLRPLEFDDFSGQSKIVENLKIFVKAAKMRGEALDHVLLHGPPGHLGDIRVLVGLLQQRHHLVKLGILLCVQLGRIGNRQPAVLALHRHVRHQDHSLVMIAHHTEEIAIRVSRHGHPAHAPHAGAFLHVGALHHSGHGIG